jgi:hypothetical protein
MHNQSVESSVGENFEIVREKKGLANEEDLRIIKHALKDIAAEGFRQAYIEFKWENELKRENLNIVGLTERLAAVLGK